MSNLSTSALAARARGTKLYVYLIRCRVGLGGEQRTALRCDFKTISPEGAEALRQLNELQTTPGSDAKPN